MVTNASLSSPTCSHIFPCPFGESYVMSRKLRAAAGRVAAETQRHNAVTVARGHPPRCSDIAPRSGTEHWAKMRHENGYPVRVVARPGGEYLHFASFPLPPSSSECTRVVCKR
ncbi:hypothetical protein CDEST_03351 [Colletotrichum destructivum]|uniref:Uncharacterized protein n=1 Tax=Colletotrichum destructivum TaxID=34406 RepID=A0AAX4I4U9_9PEZI|nr:hypothetical protein CDEST_03351 [Colletotrichum destructivum]